MVPTTLLADLILRDRGRQMARIWLPFVKVNSPHLPPKVCIPALAIHRGLRRLTQLNGPQPRG